MPLPVWPRQRRGRGIADDHPPALQMLNQNPNQTSADIKTRSKQKKSSPKVRTTAPPLSERSPQPSLDTTISAITTDSGNTTTTTSATTTTVDSHVLVGSSEFKSASSPAPSTAASSPLPVTASASTSTLPLTSRPMRSTGRAEKLSQLTGSVSPYSHFLYPAATGFHAHNHTQTQLTTLAPPSAVGRQMAVAATLETPVRWLHRVGSTRSPALDFGEIAAGTGPEDGSPEDGDGGDSGPRRLWKRGEHPGGQPCSAPLLPGPLPRDVQLAQHQDRELIHGSTGSTESADTLENQDKGMSAENRDRQDQAAAAAVDSVTEVDNELLNGSTDTTHNTTATPHDTPEEIFHNQRPAMKLLSSPSMPHQSQYYESPIIPSPVMPLPSIGDEYDSGTRLSEFMLQRTASGKLRPSRSNSDAYEQKSGADDFTKTLTAGTANGGDSGDSSSGDSSGGGGESENVGDGEAPPKTDSAPPPEGLQLLNLDGLDRFSLGHLSFRLSFSTDFEKSFLSFVSKFDEPEHGVGVRDSKSGSPEKGDGPSHVDTGDQPALEDNTASDLTAVADKDNNNNASIDPDDARASPDIDPNQPLTDNEDGFTFLEAASNCTSAIDASDSDYEIFDNLSRVRSRSRTHSRSRSRPRSRSMRHQQRGHTPLFPAIPRTSSRAQLRSDAVATVAAAPAARVPRPSDAIPLDSRQLVRSACSARSGRWDRSANGQRSRGRFYTATPSSMPLLPGIPVDNNDQQRPLSDNANLPRKPAMQDLDQLDAAFRRSGLYNDSPELDSLAPQKATATPSFDKATKDLEAHLYALGQARQPGTGIGGRATVIASRPRSRRASRSTAFRTKSPQSSSAHDPGVPMTVRRDENGKLLRKRLPRLSTNHAHFPAAHGSDTTSAPRSSSAPGSSRSRHRSLLDTMSVISHLGSSSAAAKTNSAASPEECPLPPRMGARSMSAATASGIILSILRHVDNLQDLFSLAVLNRGFYITFQAHALDLMKNTLYLMSPAAYELREVSPPLEIDESEADTEQPVREYTSNLYIRHYTRDLYTMVALKSLILVRCESFLRLETVRALTGLDEARAAEIDEAFWRVWSFCHLFGRGKDRGDDITAQTDWLNGGRLAHDESLSQMLFSAYPLGVDSVLFNPPDGFAVGNKGGLNSTQLYDMMEIWTCLGSLLQVFHGSCEAARKFGVFDRCNIIPGDFVQEEAALEEWTQYILTLGPSAVLALMSTSRGASIESQLSTAKRFGWTVWERSHTDRRWFLKEAVSQVYEALSPRPPQPVVLPTSPLSTGFYSSSRRTSRNHHERPSSMVPSVRHVRGISSSSCNSMIAPSIYGMRMPDGDIVPPLPMNPGLHQHSQHQQLPLQQDHDEELQLQLQAQEQYSKENPTSNESKTLSASPPSEFASSSANSTNLTSPVIVPTKATMAVSPQLHAAPASAPVTTVSPTSGYAYPATMNQTMPLSPPLLTTVSMPPPSPYMYTPRVSPRQPPAPLPPPFPNHMETQVQDPVDVAMFKLVHELGFGITESKWALKTTDTGEQLDVEAAIDLLLQHRAAASAHPCTAAAATAATAAGVPVPVSASEYTELTAAAAAANAAGQAFYHHSPHTNHSQRVPADYVDYSMMMAMDYSATAAATGAREYRDSNHDKHDYYYDEYYDNPATLRRPFAGEIAGGGGNGLGLAPHMYIPIGGRDLAAATPTMVSDGGVNGVGGVWRPQWQWA